MTDEYTQTIVIDPNDSSHAERAPTINPKADVIQSGTNQTDPSPDPEFIQTYSYLT